MGLKPDMESELPAPIGLLITVKFGIDFSKICFISMHTG